MAQRPSATGSVGRGWCDGHMQSPTSTAAPQDTVLVPDRDQDSVLAHRDGVLLVLGAPGTGKTTTALRLVRQRIHDGLAPDSCLVLGPTRAATARLRVRLGAGLARTHTEPLARTPASLAFAVLRLAASRAGEPMPRLISGAEQDVILRELLAGHRQGGTGPGWPDQLSAALPTAGFRAQLRDLLMRAVERGLEPSDLRRLAAEHDRPEWACAADVLEEYDQVTALSDPGSYDPAWIGTAAADALEDDEALRDQVHRRLGLVVVDDAQELTASAARLLDAVRPPGCPAVLVGDPDAASQGFRGAVPGLFVDLAARWQRQDAGPRGGESGGSTVVLGRRHGTQDAVSDIGSRVASRIGVVGAQAHRQAAASGAPGKVRVELTRSSAQETTLVAGWLRTAHLVDGVPWRELAVIARSGRQQEQVRRALAVGGVPVQVDRAGLALGQDPAVTPLLLAFDVVTRSDDGPAWVVTPEEAVTLLTGPLGGVDPVGLRRLRRRLRVEELARGGARGADELLADMLTDPALRRASPADVPVDLEPLVRVGRVLDAGWLAHWGTTAESPQGSAEDVLWALWDTSGLAQEWAAQALAGGALGARADRDLDAVLVLFGAAESFVERLPGSRPRSFLEHVRSEEVAADTLVVGARTEEVVEVLTPQAAAGRRWRRVAVVGVQDGVWPDLRLRDTLLGAEALVAAVQGRPVSGQEARRAAQSQVRDDELRQFHVAVTRAREDLLVTAVSSTDEQPSGLLDLVDPDFRERPPADVEPPLTLRSIVGALRRAAVRAHRDGDRRTRDRAIQLLGRLADEGVTGADPAAWWQARQVSSERPLGTGGPARVSPSRVQAFIDCPLRWFLTSRGADAGGGAGAAELGTLVHEIVAQTPDASLEDLTRQLDLRWPDLGLPEGWAADRERQRAEQMLGRYVDYVREAAAEGRELVGAERDLAVSVAPETEEHGQGVRLVGTVDRLERDTQGRLVVVDLKTGKSKPSAAEVESHAQLAAYQVAVEAGAFGEGTSGGALLAQLGASGPVSQSQTPLAGADDPGWARTMLLDAGAGMVSDSFPAQDMGRRCRTCPARFSCPIVPEGSQR